METTKDIKQFKKKRKTIKLEISNFGNIKRRSPKGWTKISTSSNTKDGKKY
mgnify:CR=1 FL=1|tara:strand:+ start:338 stop:490 length:153 start_codon:yes stop_codon:yes gene_type:complete